jgi:hypothetical protein
VLLCDAAQMAVMNPKRFDIYMRYPKRINPQSKMAASPHYDDATLRALRLYFSSFSESNNMYGFK